MAIKRPVDYIAAIRRLIRRMPDGKSFVSDEALSREFFELSEKPDMPDSLRDLCINLSLRAKAVETSPLGITDAPALEAELEKRKSDPRRA